MIVRTCAGLALALALGAAGAAAAQVRLEGYFIAEAVCPATVSIRKGTNPDDAATEVRRAYDLVGINRADGTHFQIVVPGAEGSERRWVGIDCGVHAVAVGGEATTVTVRPTDGAGSGGDGSASTGATGSSARAGDGSAESRSNVLAVSWQPAFCETKPGKAECRILNADDSLPAARQFSIHGLWPQPRNNAYCDVSPSVERLDTGRDWASLPEPGIDAETAAALAVAMPGVLSDLHRHEWIKHGTCYRGAGGADEYFDDILWLMEDLNTSEVRQLFERSIGRRLDVDEVRAAFDAAFGDGAGERVSLSCNGGMIVELKLHLAGQITAGETGLGDLMSAAQPVGTGCSSGLVDPAG